MAHSRKVREILSWYASDNPGTKANLARMLNTGRLKGTGKMVILPVDQGFEHGPARSFAKNPAGYNPQYHVELAIASGCNAYAAPLGFIEAIASDYAGEIPLILKLNNSDGIYSSENPAPAVTSSVEAALRLGCGAIGYTIYPGSSFRNEQYEALAELTEEAKRNGLVVVVWSYPRGGKLTKDGETAVDISAYAAQIAAQLGAHIIKVKPSTDFIEDIDKSTKKVYDAEKIDISSLAARTKHVIDSAFGGRRVVIFSGGPASTTEKVLAEIQGLADGGAFGSIVGRNSFQRPKDEAIELLHQIQDIFKAAK